MRVNPSVKALKGNSIDPAVKAQIERVTRIVAIVFAFVSTFGLFVKILFF